MKPIKQVITTLLALRRALKDNEAKLTDFERKSLAWAVFQSIFTK